MEDLDNFQAAIFDMDGLLIDSEPFWKSAERESFAEVGIDVTEEMSAITASMTTAEVAAHWYAVRPWNGRSTRDLEQAVIARVRESITRHGQLLPGAREILHACRARGWRVALASNSPLTLCEHVIDALDLRRKFDAILSADQVARGKPAPDIYLEAARRLDAPPSRCLAFEDSVSGARAAQDAGMTVIAIPSATQMFNPSAQIAHAVFPSLLSFWKAHFT
jgi:HAD superfamily hydrolase (TIGR01509 family)